MSIGTVEWHKHVPVARDVDVAVAGCGLSGIFAALGAARQGAKTVVVDRMFAPGGNVGPGMFIGASLADPRDLPANDSAYHGLLGDFYRRYRRRMEGVPYPVYASMSHAISRVVIEMCQDAGVELVLSAYVGDPILENGAVRGFLMETKSGTLAVRARVTIDATGDADLARRAGAPFRSSVPAEEIYSAEERAAAVDKETQPNPNYPGWNDSQVYYYAGEVDAWKLEAFRLSPCKLTQEQREWADKNLRIWSAWWDPFIPILKEGWESGEFRAEREIRPHVWVALNAKFDVGDPLGKTCMARPGHIGGKAGCFGYFDSGNWEDVAMMEREVRSIIFDGVEFFRRKGVPGFENAYVLAISPFMGARGGPFIEGEYVVTLEHLEKGKRADDVLFVSHGAWPQKTPPGGYDMPYRMLLPKQVDGLLVCGRGASYIRRGHDPGTRARGNMMLLGQAAGMAAALAAADGVRPRDLDVRKLQRALLQDGHFRLGDAQRLAQLGLG